MKKILVLLMLPILLIGVVACGSTKEPEKVEANNVGEAKPKAEYYFNQFGLEIEKASFKITDISVVQPGHLNSGYGITNENPYLLVSYDFTNKTKDEPISPLVAWSACVSATQETDKTIEDLNVGMSYLEDPTYGERWTMEQKDVKPGATVQALSSFEILFPNQPIKLSATRGVVGEHLGEFIVETAPATSDNE